RTGMRSLSVIGSTIHSMVKFPTVNGVATLKTSKESLRECSPRKEPMTSKGSWEEDTVKEKVVVRDDCPDQPVDQWQVVNRMHT
nr:reverse transcriptase domain-containing protein [Tanacetum cinerariifolium]